MFQATLPPVSWLTIPNMSLSNSEIYCDPCGLPRTFQGPLADFQCPPQSSLPHTSQHTFIFHYSTCFAFSTHSEQVMIISRASGYGCAGCVLSNAIGHCSHKLLSKWQPLALRLMQCWLFLLPWFSSFPLPICLNPAHPSKCTFAMISALTMPTLICLLLLWSSGSLISSYLQNSSLSGLPCYGGNEPFLIHLSISTAEHSVA